MMPWKETDVMRLREEFVLRTLSGGESFTDLCAEYGISRKTGYKWKERFVADGLAGLRDRSRRPERSAGSLGEACVCELVRLKTAHPTWGPKKIRELHARLHSAEATPSLSSVKRVLDRSGLVQRRRRRPSKACGRVETRLPAMAPNDVWTVDFKGWWYTSDQRRCEPLTIRDHYSRYLLCVSALDDARSDTVRDEFQRAFTRYGLPKVIRSDNGVLSPVRAPREV